MHQKVIGVDICGECSFSEPLQQRETIMKEYDRETQLWNSVYAESPSVDLRTENLSVEVMFDVCLRLFAEHTVLDVMPEEMAEELLSKINRVLKKNGYWFIKLNPYYSAEELQSFGYHQL